MAYTKERIYFKEWHELSLNIGYQYPLRTL